MPRKFLDPYVNNFIKCYQSGMSMNEIAKQFGVNPEAIRKRFIKRGIPRRSISEAQRLAWAKKRCFDIDEAIRLYESGSLYIDIARKFGVHWNSVRSALIRRGVKSRSISEVQKIKISRLSKEEIARQTKAAHDAVRGMRRTMEDLCKRAKGKEIKQSHATRIERICAQMLWKEGFACVLQKAIGPYNVDIAITEPPITVDIFGGNWHASGRHAARFRKRFDYILDQNWLPVIIWVIRDYPLEIRAIEYIVSLAEKIRGGETIGRQEHMIRGNGEPTTIGENNFNNRS